MNRDGFIVLPDGGVRMDWPQAGVTMIFSDIKKATKGYQAKCDIAIDGRTVNIVEFDLLDQRQRYFLERDLFEKRQWDWHGAFVQAAFDLRKYFGGGDEVVNLDSVMLQAPPSPLIDPIVDSTINVWAAHGGTGKSIMAIAAAYQLTTGAHILGYSKYPPMNTLILDYEEVDAYIAAWRRYLIMCGHPAALGDKSMFYRNESMPIVSTAPTLKRIIDDMEIGFVVIDSLGIARGGAAESATDTIAAMDAIRFLGVPTLVLDHLKHEDAGVEGQTRPFGSVYTRNLARSLWTVRRNQSDSEEIEFVHRKGNHRRPDSTVIYRIDWQPDSITVNLNHIGGFQESDVEDDTFA